VDIVVSQLAIAGIPNPMPIIMEFRPRQRDHGRRASPQIDINRRRNLTLTRSPNRPTPPINNAPGQFHFSQLAIVNVFDRLSQGMIGTILRSSLANAIELPRRLDIRRPSEIL